uniref:40S ribosomal protein S27 n=1 Tax=Meloidogyne javanica TaxID=6303 RepID=A0A915LVQ2_MELJA
MPLAVDLLHPDPVKEQQKHKLKRLVQHPNSFFMDVKCPGCYKITTVFSHAQSVVVCVGCSTVLCQPTDVLNKRGINSTNNSKINFDDAKLIFTKDSKFASIELFQKASNASTNEKNTFRIPLVWLRDHCRNSNSYNWDTNQRKANCTDLFGKAVLAEDCYPIHFDVQTQKLKINWADGEESVFVVNELLKWGLFSEKQYTQECIDVDLDDDDGVGKSSCPSRTLWRGESLKEVPSLSSINFDFSTFARLFIRFGVVCVTGVETHDRGKATRKLCEKIAPMHNTFFGDFWHFGTDNELGMATFDDTAYGSEEIGPHSDGTYFDQPPGIQ